MRGSQADRVISIPVGSEEVTDFNFQLIGRARRLRKKQQMNSVGVNCELRNIGWGGIFKLSFFLLKLIFPPSMLCSSRSHYIANQSCQICLITAISSSACCSIECQPDRATESALCRSHSTTKQPAARKLRVSACF